MAQMLPLACFVFLRLIAGAAAECSCADVPRVVHGAAAGIVCSGCSPYTYSYPKGASGYNLVNQFGQPTTVSLEQNGLRRAVCASQSICVATVAVDPEQPATWYIERTAATGALTARVREFRIDPTFRVTPAVNACAWFPEPNAEPYEQGGCLEGGCVYDYLFPAARGLLVDADLGAGASLEVRQNGALVARWSFAESLREWVRLDPLGGGVGLRLTGLPDASCEKIGYFWVSLTTDDADAPETPGTASQPTSVLAIVNAVVIALGGLIVIIQWIRSRGATPTPQDDTAGTMIPLPAATG